jgi:hypothetical protein
MDDLSKEQKILVTMRKVLTTIIRELTPPPGDKYPLSESTTQDIRFCLGLIITREKELAEALGNVNPERPHYIDEQPTSQVVQFSSKKN